MKRNNLSGYRLGLIAIFIALLINACSTPGDLGMELLPTSDLISMRSISDNNISAYTIKEDSLRTDEPGTSLLGSIVDPVFGKTTIGLACQFRLSYFPDFTDDAVADSIFLYLYYKEIYGDTVTPQHLKVYELKDPIDVDQSYYFEDDIAAYADSKLLGECEFTPRFSVSVDSVYGTLDTLYQAIKVPMDMSLAQKLINADSTDMTDNELFLNFFKGLYIKSEDVGENGTILSLELIANSSTNGSALLLHYHQTNVDTGEPDTLTNAYLPTSFSARISSFNHDYSGLPIADAINNQQEHDKVYIQSTGGLRSKLFIPGLETWIDSVNFAINKAELVFHVDSIASDPKKYAPPSQLLLTIIDDDGKEYLPKDYTFSPTFYGGLLDTTDYTYRFNITQHMQEVVDGKFNNNGFYLGTINKNSEFRRVILKGTGGENGIQLNIAYSKVIQ